MSEEWQFKKLGLIIINKKKLEFPGWSKEKLCWSLTSQITIAIKILQEVWDNHDSGPKVIVPVKFLGVLKKRKVQTWLSTINVKNMQSQLYNYKRVLIEMCVNIKSSFQSLFLFALLSHNNIRYWKYSTFNWFMV